jgi:hypothetical protein
MKMKAENHRKGQQLFFSVHILYPSGLWSSVVILGLRRQGVRLITRINQYRSEEPINLVQIAQAQGPISLYLQLISE